MIFRSVRCFQIFVFLPVFFLVGCFGKPLEVSPLLDTQAKLKVELRNDQNFSFVENSSPLKPLQEVCI